jgi:hypothetical protein
MLGWKPWCHSGTTAQMEVWCVPSATGVPGIHFSLVCTICYRCARYTLQSCVYHLLPVCQVYTAVWCVPSATSVPGILCSLVCTTCYYCASYTQVWCVASATSVPGIHCSLVCTTCYQCDRYTLKSGVYHLLPVCQVHTAVRMTFWASECLLHYL